MANPAIAQELDIRRLSGSLGAEVHGIPLAGPLT